MKLLVIELQKEAVADNIAIIFRLKNELYV